MEVALLAPAFRATLDEQAVLVRTVIAAVGLTSVLQAWRRPVPMYVAASLGSVGAAFVLQRAFPAFIAMNATCLLVARTLQASRHRWRNTAISLVTLVLVFLAARHRGWDTAVLNLGRLSVPWFYLDMWMLLRTFVLFWEAGSGRQGPPEILAFTAWCTSPLFLAGPLLRCSQWPEVLIPRSEQTRELEWWRDTVGGLAMAVVGLALVSLMRVTNGGPEGRGLLAKLLLVFFLGPWGFYLTIAGTFQFLSALSRLNGIPVGPSFDRPFFQPNIAEFWARWNMTATSVFREYFFFNRWGLRSFNPYLNTLVVFLAVGLWHGSNVYWISFGLLHALYFSTYLWFRSWSARNGFHSPPLFGGALTYLCVCMAWYIPSKVVSLLNR